MTWKRPPPRVKPYTGINPSAARAPAVRVPDLRSRAVVPIEKHEYVRSAGLMKAYRLIPCQSCGANDGTVCGAHSNWHPHHKGGAIKADDNRAASLCVRCHSMLDQGSALTLEAKRRLWWRAHASSCVLLAKLRLWPKAVPFPEINAMPEAWT